MNHNSQIAMTTPDDYVLKLSTTLHNIIDFFQVEQHRKILEVETNVDSKHQYQQLLRINNSLEQYIDKNQDLFYVGFLGSYSSGKTSTINSLLNLWGCDQCRKVSNNPTDTYISLISNSSNTDKIMSFSKEGAVPIRTLTNFDVDFLDKIVIMDTPGSGDPNILEAIVRDSLPLCDLIIYTLNATAPFTDIDRPFLLAQQEKLSNIPILFVVTRGDEFAIDKNRPFDNDNLDCRKYDDELETLIRRLNETLKISNFDKEQFILIDNKTSFNIDRLKEVINRCISNPDKTLVQLHNHKLHYFEKEIQSIYSYFKTFAETKIGKCDILEKQVSTNVDEFTTLVKSSKHKFIEIWDECKGQIGKIYDGTYSGYLDRTVAELNDIRNFVCSEEYDRFDQEVKNQLQEDAEKRSQQIIKEIIRNVTTILSGYKSKIGQIRFENFPQDLFVAQNEEIDISVPACLISDDDFCQKFLICKNDYSRKRDASIEKNVKQLEKSISNKIPIDSIFKQIESCKSKSLSEMQRYYLSVKMYKVAAFSLELKQIVSDLGLAGQLDEIEKQSVDKERYNNMLVQVLYETIDKYIEQFKIDANTISGNIQAIGVYPEANMQNSDSFAKPEYSDTHISEHTMRCTKDFITNTRKMLIQDISEKFHITETNIAGYKRSRIKKYVRSLIIFFIGGVGLVLLISYWHEAWYTGVAGTIIGGVISSLLATGIVAMFDKTKTLSRDCIEHFNRQMQQYTSNIDLKLRDFEHTIESEKNNLGKDIFKIWETRLHQLSDALFRSIEPSENSSMQWLSQFIAIIKEYNRTYFELNANILHCIDNHTSNLQKLDSITTLIKEEAIEPSFHLLRETFDHINAVQNKIDSLQAE